MESIELESTSASNLSKSSASSLNTTTKEHKHKHHHHDHGDHHHDHEHHHDDEDDNSTDQTQLLKTSSSGLMEYELDRVKLNGETLKKIYLSKSKPLWKEPDFVKMVIMITMVLLMFLAELTVGVMAESLTLLADSFHMLSDGISLMVGAACIWLAKKGPTNLMTFGFGRAETLGGLINAVFLVSVVLYVIMESIQRFFMPERITDPLLVLCVGGAGLLINLIGLVMFCGHHPHPGHDHDHDHGHGHSHKHSHEEHDHDHEHEHNHDHDHSHHEHEHTEKKEHKEHKHRSENIFGVFLHILGDFLGSIAVMISSGLLLIFDKKDENGNYPHTWVLYVDPVLSLIMSGIILVTAIPLLKSTCRTLLQSVPHDVDIPKLKSSILEVEGVLSCHELHVWQLVGKTSIASVHILTTENNRGFMRIAKQLQKVFHKFNIHASTIQPEFISSTSNNKGEEAQPCHLLCTDTCYEHFCCAPNPAKEDIDPAENV
ncbi:cation efflux protein [Naegleria gruberi]|uniref:Cation efflux protein n=1 Tax=Naegleria gruberi TaxID=5762 RepID=D2W1A9_NAEGR|nr:cation efflux protein [Naegleria gruberi]EFC37153.1 cation efflux protein [Naegleria gruberi]|eukprot:XP_002669897.1 cation efflux protein [Naegleria gruberi strain NEG-M]